MTRLTAMIIASNYPEQIQIAAAKLPNGKFQGLLYQMKDGAIHTLLLSTNTHYDTEKAAEDVLHEAAKEVKSDFENDKL